MHTFIFGVFREGKLLFLIGNKVTCTIDQAEIIACLMILLGVEKCLNDGDYFAYDYFNL